MIPAVLFFALGYFAKLVKSDLKFPADMAKALSIYLLISIGIHGGHELAKADLFVAFKSIIVAMALGLLLPLLAYRLLLTSRRMDRLNAAAIAAHYGSVSAGTFLTAVAFLDSAGIAYESYPLIMLAVMESPAIIVGLLLAAWARKKMNPISAEEGNGSAGGLGEILRDAFTNGSVILLIGSMIIGAVAKPTALEKVLPFVDEIFMGVLCLFLLEMGMEAGRRANEFRRVGAFLVSFGIAMPLIGGLIGVVAGGVVLGFGVGGTVLVAVLGASASYIAVPPAMRLAIPEANPSYYLTLALGVTFPFNVVFGIPLYQWMAERLAAI
jgi:hypothetical protein